MLRQDDAPSGNFRLIAAGGTIEIDGEKVGQDIDFPSNIGVLIENPAFLPSRTGLDNLMLLLSLEGCRDCDVAKRALASVGLSQMITANTESILLECDSALGLLRPS